MVDGHTTDLELQNRATFRLPVREGIPIDDHLRVCGACNARYLEIAKHYASPPPAPKPATSYLA
jgi:predicted anti-sigma-YlaC factor YlaD